MKKNYIAPEIYALSLRSCDVITASGDRVEEINSEELGINAGLIFG